MADSFTLQATTTATAQGHHQFPKGCEQPDKIRCVYLFTPIHQTDASSMACSLLKMDGCTWGRVVVTEMSCKMSQFDDIEADVRRSLWAKSETHLRWAQASLQLIVYWVNLSVWDQPVGILLPREFCLREEDIILQMIFRNNPFIYLISTLDISINLNLKM